MRDNVRLVRHLYRSFVYENGIVMLYRHVCPVIPRRYAHLLREFVDAIDGASAVAASNDELTIYERDDKLFPFALVDFR